jgi:hypothetical protein
VRLPFPERIPVRSAAAFAVVLYIVQRLEGTGAYFAAGCFLFILISTLAFNTAGGLTRASGAYVFFYSTLVVIVGLCYKAFLGEPADSHLLDPRTDIEVYVGGIAAMYAAVFASRLLSRKTGLLEHILADSQMYRASLGCMVFGALGSFALALFGESADWLQTAFAQINYLIPIGIIIGVLHQVRHSGGRRSVNPFIVAAIVYFFVFYGLAAFSKQGMLTPLMCWAVAIAAQGYRLSKVQIAGCVLAAFVIFHYLVPYAQYGRSQLTEADQSFSAKFAIALPLLENAEQTRQTYASEQKELPPGPLGEYFDSPQGFWDRLQFISVDDSLINITDQGKVFGLWPLKFELLNSIPHFLWPNKPSINFGMMFVHEIDPSHNADDTTTGISFSPTSQAYHMARWTGVLVIAPLVWLAFFVAWDSLLGRLNSTPWGLIGLVMVAHIAPEGGLSGAIHLITYGSETLIFCALFTIWIAPALGDMVIGPRKADHGGGLIRPRLSALPEESGRR